MVAGIPIWPVRRSCGRSPTVAPPRAVWGALPGEDWPLRIAEAAAATVRAGRGVVVVVADARDLERVDRALTDVLGAGRHVALNAALGPGRALPAVPGGQPAPGPGRGRHPGGHVGAGGRSSAWW